MQRVIEEMAKAKGDVERRYREMLPDIIRECMAFAYLGKSFTFDANTQLSDKVNRKLIALGDEIMEDIEARAKRCIAYADAEEDEEEILAYVRRKVNEEDLLSRIDKHNSNFRYFLEGWMAIGIVNSLSQQSLINNIMTYMHNVYVSKLWQDALKEGYLSNAIRSPGYSFGKGNMRNPIMALTELVRDAINTAYQRGCVFKYEHFGAIAYRTHRASSFDCSHCDDIAMQIWPLDKMVLPAHPRCVCYSTPVFADGSGLPNGKELTYYNSKSNGWVITDSNRISRGTLNKQSSMVYEKEKNMCLVLADNGYKVCHLGEISGVSSSDITINGITADLKKTSSANNIQSYASKALKKQGANIVVFEFEKETSEIYLELQKLKRKGYKAKYFFSGKNKVYDL